MDHGGRLERELFDQMSSFMHSATVLQTRSNYGAFAHWLFPSTASPFGLRPQWSPQVPSLSAHSSSHLDLDLAKMSYTPPPASIRVLTVPYRMHEGMKGSPTMSALCVSSCRLVLSSRPVSSRLRLQIKHSWLALSPHFWLGT